MEYPNKIRRNALAAYFVPIDLHASHTAAFLVLFFRGPLNSPSSSSSSDGTRASSSSREELTSPFSIRMAAASRQKAKVASVNPPFLPHRESSAGDRFLEGSDCPCRASVGAIVVDTET